MKDNRDYNNDTKIALLEQNNDHIHKTLERIENNLILFKSDIKQEILGLENKIVGFRAEIKKEISELRDEISEVRKDSFSHFKWLICTVILFSGSPIIIESIKLIINALKS